MRSPLLTKLSFAAGLLFAAGCGRSLLFNPATEISGTTGGSAAASSSGGATGGGTAGTSGGHTTGGASSGGGVAGSSGGACEQVGAACSQGSDCCGDYCRKGICRCNVGDRGYPCRSDGDCCKPAVCGADGTCRTPKTSGGNGNGGNAGGSSGGSGCTPGGAPNELSPCQTGADCGCPLQCTPTAIGRSICEYACRSNTDCPSLYTTCRRGSCQPDVCGVSFGGQNGTLDGLCNSVGTDDGSCVPVQIQGFTVGLCLEGGSAMQSCSLSATRADLSQACPAGELCAGSTCAQLCNPNGTVPCPSGEQCTAVSGQSPELGLCVGASGGITGGIGGIGGIGGGSGSSSGGSIGGGNGTSGGSGGGCNVSIPVQEMAPCTSDADCGCPTTCVFDVLQNQQVCEYPCAQTSDCPTLYTVCTGTSCTIDLCGVALGGPPNGTLDGSCNAAGTNDGTCLPVGTNDAGVTFGICTQAGQSTSTCQSTATRSDPGQACAQGWICSGNATAPAGNCYQVCDPSSPTICSSSQKCAVFNPQDPLLGVCYPP